jgi:hypothetical protein
VADEPDPDKEGQDSGQGLRAGHLLGSGRERYGLALLLILASILFVMVADDGPWSRVVTITLQSLAVVASLRAAEAPLLFRQVVTALVVGVLCFAFLQAAFADEVSLRFVEAATLTLILVATPTIAVGLVRQFRSHRGANLRTMLGVLCIYLLISLAFAAGYGVVDAFGDRPFFTQGEQWSAIRDYQYFSLTTITTFGIGDLTPASDAGRALTAAEALLGQIYLVTVVALIVGNLRPSRA